VIDDHEGRFSGQGCATSRAFREVAHPTVDSECFPVLCRWRSIPHKCHPERSSRFAKRSSHAVEGPLHIRHSQRSVKAFSPSPVWSGHSCPLPMTLISSPHSPTPPNPRPGN
jgi:hypothetical protein